MQLNSTDGSDNNWDKEAKNSIELKEILDKLSTEALFYRFAKDFRRSQ